MRRQSVQRITATVTHDVLSNGERTSRAGSSTWPIVVMVASLALLGLLFFSLGRPTVRTFAPLTTGKQSPPIIIYCAASNKGVVEAIRQDYELEFGTEVLVQFGASQTLLASIEVSKSGDLYLPADDSFLKSARERGLIADEFPLADMGAVVAVKKGNPLNISTLADLLHREVRVAQGSTEATAIGKVTKATLSETGQWEALEQNTTAFKTTVNEVANDVKVGGVDAGIVYGPVLHDYDTLEGVAIPELAPIKSRVVVATLNCSRQPKEALHFARYLSAREKGLVRYREYGFDTVEGRPWSE